MTPEIYFARKLASNDKKIRDKTLKKLKKWINARSNVTDAFSEDELLKLWKGLFYCMWMSDKPLIQEDLAETISSLVHSISDRQTCMKFIKVSLVTMARDWPGIDTWRMDKFMMFVRRIVRHSLENLAKNNWCQEEVDMYSTILSDCILNANKNTADLKVPVGLQLHIINLFPEELAKAGGENLASSVILKMLEPFAKCLATSDDHRLRKEITQHVFIHLIKQSDAGVEEEEKAKLNSRKGRKPKPDEGAPTAEASEKDSNASEDKNTEESQNTEEEESEVQTTAAEPKDKEDVQEAAAVESDSDLEDANEPDGDDDEDDDGDDKMEIDWDAKDPRAGGVDVVLPQLYPDYSQLADMLFKEASQTNVRTKNRQPIYRLVKRFRDLNTGIYPLKMVLPVIGPGLTPGIMRSAKRRFLREELLNASGKEEEKNGYALSKKSKKRKTDQLEDQDDEEDDEEDIDDEDVDEEDGDEEEDVVESDAGEEVEEEQSEAKVEDGGEKQQTVNDDPVQDKAEDCGEEQDDKSADATQKPDKEQIGKFHVPDDWDVTPMKQQLKRKLKARKKMQSSWTETPMSGEVEIVIPNKKYRGPIQLKPTKQDIEEDEDVSTSSGNRRVNFILDKNMAQEPKDYQESVRKSPGIPHDPHRQPSGGVLKRCEGNSKTPVTTKRRRDLNARVLS